MLGRVPVRSPALLSTLTLRPRRLLPADVGGPPASLCSEAFRLRQSKKVAAAIAASAAKTPITTPAMAPPDMPSCLSNGCWALSLDCGAGRGVLVTVCVTTAPEMVVIITLVTGSTVDSVVDSVVLELGDDGVVLDCEDVCEQDALSARVMRQ